MQLLPMPVYYGHSSVPISAEPMWIQVLYGILIVIAILILLRFAIAIWFDRD